VAAVSFAVPVLLFLVLAERVLRPLGVAKEWLRAHHAAVMAVVLVVIGIAVRLKGIRSV
jgi:hypothetical protein